MVVLDPLQEIERKDVSLWHRNYEVDQLYQVDEDTLLHGVFGEGQPKPLRLRVCKKSNPIHQSGREDSMTMSFKRFLGSGPIKGLNTIRW